jgi:hypothetical protein
MTTTLTHRRAIANSIVSKQGVPNTQASIDSMWSVISGRLNATLPSNRAPIGSSGERSSPAGSAKPTQAETDSMWTSLATGLNTEAGLKAPTRSAR